MSGPHDLLAHYTFSIPTEAVAELRLALPPELVALLDWSSLHVESAIIVDPRLQRTEKDLVYSLRFLTGQPARILVLFEHLSTPPCASASPAPTSTSSCSRSRRSSPPAPCQ